MKRLPINTNLARGAALIAGLLAVSATALAAGENQPRPTDFFRKEHADIKTHLEHVDTMVGGLATADPAARKKTMAFVVKFFREHIEPHAKWEEKALYPAVDKRVGAGEHPFTESMRYEHRIVGEWIEDLSKESAKTSPDHVAFARRADKLLGLIIAHFEEEEEVLLPILDKGSTAEQLKKELAGAGHH